MSITLDGTAGISSTGGIDAADLTGALPALDGAALTALTSANLTGALPAISGSNLTGLDSPIKAWVNFNGTGVVAIRASSNVSSITDNGTGDYTVNFATAMSNANYAVTAVGQLDETDTNGQVPITGVKRFSGAQAVGSVRLSTTIGGTTVFDCLRVSAIVAGE